MTLAPEALAAYATDLARAFGSPLAFELPHDARARASVLARVREVLAAVRPRADGPSLAEALDALVGALVDARGRRLDAARAKRPFVELRDLFAQAAFRRTKRAERVRLFAQLVVVFELEPALGLEPGAGADAEAQLKRVRARLRDPA